MECSAAQCHSDTANEAVNVAAVHGGTNETSIVY
ncbi:MAG: CxxxxCH/CxxCH domain-containing protein [Lachnospiraceae bacterium]|nr:CxxxxCH/CxxCH domain-containing protein [Lachnospiraceae bacterium]MBR7019430.1 CxxxxCH/CxxCH domain-containing protein [Lachnospiraceae bacterium]